MTDGVLGAGPAADTEATRSARPLRADAAKNRQRLLDAAEEVFATEGVQAQIDLVAQHAGLGVGTLYRHFPTKESLVEAIIRSRLEQLSELADRYCTTDDPGAAFVAFLREFAGEAAMKHDLFDSLGAAGIDIKANCEDSFQKLKAAVETLLARAQAEGTIRADVTAEDAISLVVGATHVSALPGRDAAWINRMVGIVCDGLRVVPSG